MRNVRRNNNPRWRGPKPDANEILRPVTTTGRILRMSFSVPTQCYRRGSPSHLTFHSSSFLTSWKRGWSLATTEIKAVSGSTSQTSSRWTNGHFPAWSPQTATVAASNTSSTTKIRTIRFTLDKAGPITTRESTPVNPTPSLEKIILLMISTCMLGLTRQGTWQRKKGWSRYGGTSEERCDKKTSMMQHSRPSQPERNFTDGRKRVRQSENDLWRSRRGTSSERCSRRCIRRRERRFADLEITRCLRSVLQCVTWAKAQWKNPTSFQMRRKTTKCRTCFAGRGVGLTFRTGCQKTSRKIIVSTSRWKIWPSSSKRWKKRRLSRRKRWGRSWLKTNFKKSRPTCKRKWEKAKDRWAKAKPKTTWPSSRTPMPTLSL